MSAGPGAPLRRLLQSVTARIARIDVVVLFVEYERGDGGSDRAFATLQRYLAPVRGCRLTYVRIDNRREDLALRETGRLLRIGGDNRYREFSGWQKGLETVNRLALPCDVVLFVNDMFLAPGESFLKDYAGRRLFRRSLTGRVVIGRIDTAGRPLSACGRDLARWVCSNCFVAPKAAVDALGDLVTVREQLDDFLPPAYPGPCLFRADAPINDAYKAWLEEWLTERWHSRFSVDAETWDLFRHKVRNILNEALLTARLAEAGFPPQAYGDRRYY